jgi:hypothetical protein
MSDRSMVATHTLTALRLAVHLGREDAGLYRTAEQVSGDVERLMLAGLAAKKALEYGKSPEGAYVAAAKVAEPYGVRIIRAGEIKGVALGLCFWNAPCVSPDDIFRVS